MASLEFNSEVMYLNAQAGSLRVWGLNFGSAFYQLHDWAGYMNEPFEDRSFNF